MRTGIREIILVNSLGSTPARINRRTGQLYISREKWANMTPDMRLFVLLHEAGHIDQQTRDEIAADRYAFQAYAQSGKPLSKSITALTRLLHFNNPEHYDRVNAQLRRAFAFDYFINGNEKAHPGNIPQLVAAYDGEPAAPASSKKTVILAAAGALVILAVAIYILYRRR